MIHGWAVQAFRFSICGTHTTLQDCFLQHHRAPPLLLVRIGGGRFYLDTRTKVRVSEDGKVRGVFRDTACE
jgi:hypothetical protein